MIIYYSVSRLVGIRKAIVRFSRHNYTVLRWCWDIEICIYLKRCLVQASRNFGDWLPPCPFTLLVLGGLWEIRGSEHLCWIGIIMALFLFVSRQLDYSDKSPWSPCISHRLWGGCSVILGGSVRYSTQLGGGCRHGAFLIFVMRTGTHVRRACEAEDNHRCGIVGI